MPGGECGWNSRERPGPRHGTLPCLPLLRSSQRGCQWVSVASKEEAGLGRESQAG